ncbi:CxC2 domain-containing protein [Mycena indigotica]|uniref:CxC2 domain-containing protein n=1 Tax=Mycena indigotica TaxID=2126181 RepID=A0A8H6SDE3_9AGAR|nr:CxC2 domain-containing protein [Mycena indigotica]KAF7297486.1 CxC2 domain-containing protein [Mycena indigotica]
MLITRDGQLGPNATERSQHLLSSCDYPLATFKSFNEEKNSEVAGTSSSRHFAIATTSPLRNLASWPSAAATGLRSCTVLTNLYARRPRLPRPATPEALPQPDFLTYEPEPDIPGVASQKRAAQFYNWSQMMPKLVQDLLEIQHKTESLRYIERLSAPVRHCPCNKRVLKVTLIQFNVISETTLQLCTCSNAAAPRQLLRAGFFACSPCNPTLAVDITLLDFVRNLFLHISPNNTAFCRALEGTLAERGLRLFSGELRLRFNNALQWYTQVVVMAQKHIDNALVAARTLARDAHDADTEALVQTSDEREEMAPEMPHPQVAFSSCGQKRSRHELDRDAEDSEDEARKPPSNPFPDPPPRSRPSDYLISRSKNQGQQTINAVFAAERSIETLSSKIRKLELSLAELTGDQALAQQERLAELESALRKVKKNKRKNENKLGTGDTATLKLLRYKEYFSEVVNASTGHERILQKFRARKMEFDPIERSVRRSSSEWAALGEALANCNEEPLGYQLLCRREFLLDLLLKWKRSLDSLVVPPGVPDWGPSSDAILRARLARLPPAETEDGGSDSGSEGVLEEDAEDDPALIPVLSLLDRGVVEEDGEAGGEEDDNDFFIT